MTSTQPQGVAIIRDKLEARYQADRGASDSGEMSKIEKEGVELWKELTAGSNESEAEETSDLFSASGNVSVRRTYSEITLKCLSPQHSFQFIYSPKSSQIYCVIFRTFGLKTTFLFSLKDGKGGHTLIHNRAMKGNRFDTGFTSQINLDRSFSKKQQNAEQSMTSTHY